MNALLPHRPWTLGATGESAGTKLAAVCPSIAYDGARWRVRSTVR